jgi:hypothetical protein
MGESESVKFDEPATITGRRILGWGIVGIIAVASLIIGVRLMRWTYETTDPVRFSDDVIHGMYWGFAANGPEGFLNQYEKMAVQEAGWLNWLDYAPLRLMVISRWTDWLSTHYPEAVAERDPEHGGRPAFPLIAPLLGFNLAMIGIGAVSAFGLTRLWVRRASGRPGHFTGVWQGTAAALMFWFNPATLISAFGWPTWDIWVAPIYLLAAWLASAEWWFAAGIAIGLGAMLKGQQLAVAPIFLIWPIVTGRVGPALRWIGGAVLAIAAVGSPWLFSYLPADSLADARDQQMQYHGGAFVFDYPQDLFQISRTVDWPAIAWVAGVLLATAGLPMLTAWLHRRWRSFFPEHAGSLRWVLRGVAMAGIVLAAGWPMVSVRGLPAIAMVAIVAGIGVTAVWAATARGWSRAYVPASATAVAALMCMVVFHGSNAWWKCGIGYGMEHWPRLATGPIDNLPGLFQDRFGWNDSGDWHQDLGVAAFTIPGTQVAVSERMLFNSAYIVLLIASGIGIGLQARRRDRRMLVALVTPWLVFFCLPVQIQERYLLFGAAASAICIGESIGMSLLGLFLSLVAAAMTLNVMMNANEPGLGRFGRLLSESLPWLFSPSAGETLHYYIDNSHPDLAWGVLIATGVFLYVSLTRARASSPGRGQCDMLPGVTR